MSDVIYYSHSMRKYDTKAEKKELSIIAKAFTQLAIYNPNNKEIQNSSFPMVACLKVIEDDQTKVVVFSTYKDHVGRGVYTEVLEARMLGKPVYMIKGRKVISFDNMRLRVIDRDWATYYAVVEKESK